LDTLHGKQAILVGFVLSRNSSIQAHRNGQVKWAVVLFLRHIVLWVSLRVSGYHGKRMSTSQRIESAPSLEAMRN
jgi:hypothetical protein